jgi:F0F1-type ATP synthase membrane subunit c/vacuolar-type H+-ATPase subunit K
LGIGNVSVREHFANFSVTSQKDLLTVIQIFDNYPLNTSKNLNYLLWKKGFELYYNRKNSNINKKELTEELVNLKNQMNSRASGATCSAGKRSDFKQPENHRINITPYWLLGFVEAEGYFSVVFIFFLIFFPFYK